MTNRPRGCLRSRGALSSSGFRIPAIQLALPSTAEVDGERVTWVVLLQAKSGPSYVVSHHDAWEVAAIKCDNPRTFVKLRRYMKRI